MYGKTNNEQIRSRIKQKKELTIIQSPPPQTMSLPWIKTELKNISKKQSATSIMNFIATKAFYVFAKILQTWQRIFGD